jgi:hypothetical protein
MKITQYKTLSYTNPQLLDDKVNVLLNDGFELFGNPYCVVREQGVSSRELYCQAMVSDREPPPKQKQAG